MHAIADTPKLLDALSGTAQHPLRMEQPLPPELGYCRLIHGFLSPQECRALVAAAEHRGFASAETDYPPSYRNNERQLSDDRDLARQLFRRLRAQAPATIVDQGGVDWQIDSLNERIRLCRYRPGQRFGIHQDGVHHRGPACRSLLTFMIYLTDGDDFEGGDTLFYTEGPQAGGEPAVVARVRPRLGSLILFDHRIWHAGETLARGSKHILRSDLLYRRDAAQPDTIGAFAPGHEGYVWAIAGLAGGRIASGGRDGCIRLWDADGRSVGTLQGHRQSVLGLAETQPGRLASVSRDRSLRYWDLASGQCLQEVEAHCAAALSLVALDGGLLVTSGADHEIRLWGDGGVALGKLQGHRGWVWALASLGHRRVASASEDGSVRIWELDSGRCETLLPGSQPLRTIDSLRLSESCWLLAAGDAGGCIRLWRIEQGRIGLLARWQAHEAAVRRVRLLSAEVLASGGEDRRLRLWRTADASCICERLHDNFVTDIIGLPQGDLLSCSYDGSLRRHVLADSFAGLP